MSSLVGNPEDRFSRDAAQIVDEGRLISLFSISNGKFHNTLMHSLSKLTTKTLSVGWLTMLIY